MTRRIVVTGLWGAAVLVVLLAVVIWWIVRPTVSLGPGGESRGGRSILERWCATQIRAIAADLLRPTLEIGGIEYQFPATAVFHDVKLRDGEDVVVEADALRIQFAETPRVGQPVVIEQAHLTRPIVRLLVRPNGTLAGFHDLVKSTEGTVRDDGGSTRPSDVLAIRQLGLESGTVIYRELSGETMHLDDITMDLGSEPRGDDPGAYDLVGRVQRSPVLEVDLDAQLDIDTAEVQFRNSKLQIKLGPDQYGSLPPQIQQFARDHEISGEFVLTVSGLLPLADMAGTALGLEANLTDGHILLDEYVLPIKSLNIQGRQTATRLDLSPITLAIYDGTAEGGVDIRFSETSTIDIDARGQGMQLEQALRTPPGEQARFAGIVSFNAGVRIKPEDPDETLGGSGSFAIRDAQLLSEPVLGGLAKLLGFETRAGEGRSDYAGSDFELFDDRVHLENLELIGGAIACTGRGDIFYDERVNLVVRAGYIKRAQLRLGSVGKLLGAVTDRIVSYRVGGTMSEPTYTVQPLGIGGGGGK